MGQSIETRVRVVAFQDVFKTADLEYVRHEEYPDDTEVSSLTPKAAKALKGTQPGDIVEVVWDYDIERPVYPIVQARRITGTTEARVEELEAEVKRLREALDLLASMTGNGDALTNELHRRKRIEEHLAEKAGSRG